MFLQFLKNEDEKKALIQMAVLISISNVENEKKNAKDDLTENVIGFEESEEWKMSSKERKIISGIIGELIMSAELTDEYFDHTDIEHDKFNEIIEEMSPVLAKISRLTEDERRIEIITNLLEEGIDWKSIKKISPQSKRAMLIELLGVALVDDHYASTEQFVIEAIAQKFNIDSDDLEEMVDYVQNVQNMYNEGLEIIQN